ncbi:hypothetical protein BGW37DRAFT_492110 [Umbelopsis sp. PMI_123]|nr:hypothetical protein BGW37DRAFT_492110 [Umbelopsis sp. PMI_123]
MLKALFVRKRTAITYKSRIESSIFSEFEGNPYVLPTDNLHSQPFEESPSRLTREQTTENRDNGCKVTEKKEKEDSSASEEATKPITNIIGGTNIDHSGIIAPVDAMSVNLSESPHGSPNSEASLQQAPEYVKKRKRAEQQVEDPFSIFDFLESDSDGTVELMKAKPAALLRKTTLETTQTTKTYSEQLSVIKEKSTKKLVTRLKEESSYAVDSDDTSQSELSDFEPFTDDAVLEVSDLVSKEQEKQVSDPREAELSSFMRQEFGMETGKVGEHEQQKKQSQRKQYVPQNKIKAQFTYGSSRKNISCQNETQNQPNQKNSTMSVSPNNQVPVCLDNTTSNWPTPPEHNTTPLISSLSSPMTSNNDMYLDGQNVTFKNPFGHNDVCQPTKPNLEDFLSVNENLSILITWLSNIPSISCVTTFSQKSADGQMGTNVLAAQTLVAYLAQTPDGVHRIETAIKKNHLVKILKDNIETDLDAFAELDTLNSKTEILHAILDHSLNCLIIMEQFTTAKHDFTSSPDLCDTLLQMLEVYQECTVNNSDQISALACSGVYTILQQLVNITYHNPANCHIMTQQFVLFDNIASKNCQTTMKIAGDWKCDFAANSSPSEFFLPFHTTVLALGVMVNLFEGDPNAASQYNSLGTLSCQNLGSCGKDCTGSGKIARGAWLYDVFKVLSSDEINQDHYKYKLVTYISLALGYLLQAGDSTTGFAALLRVSSQDYTHIVNYINLFAEESGAYFANASRFMANNAAGTTIITTYSQTTSAQAAARQLVLQLQHSVQSLIQ